MIFSLLCFNFLDINLINFLTLFLINLLIITESYFSAAEFSKLSSLKPKDLKIIFLLKNDLKFLSINFLF